MAFTVNELIRPQMSWVSQIADVKTIGAGDKAMFSVRMDGLRAFIQAKGSTTARSKIAQKQVLLETDNVSVRPVINVVELRQGRVQMADLIRDGALKMEYAMTAHIQNVLHAAASAWAAPFYGAGMGLVKTTLDPMIIHWLRTGGAAVLGDIAIINQLSALTGFTAAVATRQFSDAIILEQNRSGYIGVYNGASVMRIVNPYLEDNVTPLLSHKHLYILPTGADTSTRPLKVAFEGDVTSIEATNIDDLSFEVRLDRYFGAGIIMGVAPNISVYEDQSI